METRSAFAPAHSLVRSRLRLSLDNSLVDAAVHAPDQEREEETDHGPYVLEEDPVVHEFEVTKQAVAVGVILELGLLHHGNKPSAIDGQTDANKVI